MDVSEWVSAIRDKLPPEPIPIEGEREEPYNNTDEVDSILESSAIGNQYQNVDSVNEVASVSTLTSDVFVDLSISYPIH